MAGIYKIQNTIDNKVYIGQSINCETRFQHHLKTLKGNYHYNKYLQRAWNKYGESKFTFEIIEECTEEQLNERELFWINQYDGMDSILNYNLGAVLGGKPSFETLQKLIDSHKGTTIFRNY